MTLVICVRLLFSLVVMPIIVYNDKKGGIFMDNKTKAACAGLFSEVIYGCTVALYMVTKTEAALTLWELMSVFGAAVLLIVMTVIAKEYHIKDMYSKLMNISLCGTLFITSAAHFTSIGVTRKLAADGIDVPDHFKIGMFPSYEMTLDYIAWGFFMGAAFLAMSLGIGDKVIKKFSAASALLCFVGFIGSFFRDFLWYPAPLGYVAVFMIMLIYVMKSRRTNRS